MSCTKNCQQGRIQIIKNLSFLVSESTFKTGKRTVMAGNPMGLILSPNGPNLPFEILGSCRRVLFPASTLYPPVYPTGDPPRIPLGTPEGSCRRPSTAP